MPLFRISLTPSRRAAVRFISQVRRAFQRTFAEESKRRGLTQAAIARVIGVHRSVINRELTGRKDITVGRIGELAFAMGRVPHFDLIESPAQIGMVPIKTVAVEVSGTDSTPFADSQASIIDEWKRQAESQPVFAAAA
jgi:transcriptional regulator with XRE-family HTH domain